MTHPTQSVPNENNLNIRKFCPIQYLLVRDKVIPTDLKNWSQVPLLEGS